MQGPIDTIEALDDLLLVEPSLRENRRIKGAMRVAWLGQDAGRPTIGEHSVPVDSARTTNATECQREEFKRRMKTQTVLPSV